MADPPSGENDLMTKLNEQHKQLPYGDVRDWMTKFNELQKQQVEALVLQNQNQKLQLEILSLQLRAENERNNKKTLNEPEGSKTEIQNTNQPQKRLNLPGQIPLSPITSFVRQLSSEEFSQLQNFDPEGSQGIDIFPEQNQNPPELQQQQLASTPIELPDISNMDVEDTRLMMALCYNMPPPPVQAPVTSRPFTSAENQGNVPYNTTQYDQSSSKSVRVRRSEYRHNSIIGTPVSPGESPRVKRARITGNGTELSGCGPNTLACFKQNIGQRGTLGEALQTYAADVERIASTLPRKDLEECIMEIALHEQNSSMLFEGRSGAGITSKEGLVRGTLLKKCSKNDRKVVFNKDVYPMSTGLKEGGQLGAFKKLSLEILIHIITFLPLGTALKFILSVCKSFRALLSAPALWNKMVIDSKNRELSTDGFIRLVRTLPETSIRYLSIDTAGHDAGTINEVVDLLIKGKQFCLTSLHMSGKKLGFVVILNVVRRLWADKITVFSLTDFMPSKVDSEQTIKQVLSLMPSLRRLRMEGGIWDTKTLRSLSCLHGQLRNSEMNRLVGDNRLTHLSLSGPRTMVSWGDLKEFGKWFPEVEELFIQCIYGNEDEWVKNYADGPAKDWVDGTAIAFEGVKHSYRTPNDDDIPWVAMSRLKCFGCGSIGEQSKKHQVKVFENIYAAYIWRLLRGSSKTLERVELSRGQESPKQSKGYSRIFAPLPQLIPAPLREVWSVDFPKLAYIFLGFWDLDWEWFIACKSPDRDRPNSLEPILGFINVKKFIFWGCTGMPGDQNTEGEKVWVHQVKNTWGGAEVVNGLHEAIKGNKGMGAW